VVLGEETKTLVRKGLTPVELVGGSINEAGEGEGGPSRSA